MGSLFSMANTKANQSESSEISQNETSKRQRMSPASVEECPRLIPNLPDELSLQIIARLPRICYYHVRLVSRRWKATIRSSELYKEKSLEQLKSGYICWLRLDKINSYGML